MNVLSFSKINVKIVILQLWEVKLSKSCSSARDKNVATVEFLSTLNRHSRTVNVVRFSPDGEFNTGLTLDVLCDFFMRQCVYQMSFVDLSLCAILF